MEDYLAGDGTTANPSAISNATNNMNSNSEQFTLLVASATSNTYFADSGITNCISIYYHCK
jgi:hypothetical protein